MRERILKILQEFGLTHAEFTGAIGVNHSQVSSWMTGRSKMPQSTAMAFQAAFGVRWQWLINGDGPMRLAERPELTDNEKTLLDFMGKLSDAEQKYLIGAARALVDSKGLN